MALAVPVSGEVHVWSARLEVARPLLDNLGSKLTDIERERARRFRTTARGDAFVVRRGILRCLLGAYTGEQPALIQLGEGAHGKLFLAGHHGVSFNLAHSGAVALYAVGSGQDIGVDVERVRTRIDHRAVARRFFSKAENKALESLAGHRQLTSFFSCWAAKEAFVKATGAGLSRGLRGFEVPVPPPVRPTPVCDNWWLVTLAVEDGYAAALVADGQINTVTVRRWDPAASAD